MAWGLGGIFLKRHISTGGWGRWGAALISGRILGQRGSCGWAVPGAESLCSPERPSHRGIYHSHHLPGPHLVPRAGHVYTRCLLLAS